MHLDEERVQRLLHGELSREARNSALEHLAACAECRGRVDGAEREERVVGALLREIDDPAPPIDAETIASLARESRQSGDGGSLRRAAGFLLALGLAGATYAAYAAPGSPLPAWTASVAGWLGGRHHESAPAVAPAEGAGVAGIAVDPGTSLLILFTSPEAAGRARVTLTDGPDVAVHAPIGAATFTTDAERLVIDNHGASATYRIEIPRGAPRVEIRVGSVPIFLKEGARVTPAPADTPAVYLLRLTPS